MTGETRRTAIRKVQSKYKWFYGLFAGAVGLVFGIWIASQFFRADSQSFWMNVVTEGFGVVASVVITVFVIDRMYERRDRERLKKRLIREAGSRSNNITIAAIDELRNNKWLEGDEGLLQGANLHKANLQRADISNANLQGANLNDANLREVTLHKVELQDASLICADMRGVFSWDANLQGAMMQNVMFQGAKMGNANLQNANLDCARLQGAELVVSNLQRATMYRANLQRANLCKTDLKNADMRFADLKEAYLREANLEAANLLGANLQDVYLVGANLQGANLCHANLHDAKLYNTTFGNEKFVDDVAVLPDGTEYAKDVQLEKFTDRNHPEYKATLEKINEIRKEMELNPILQT